MLHLVTDGFFDTVNLGSKIPLLGNIMTSKTQVKCKVIETASLTVSNVCLLLVIYYDFWSKNGSKSASLHCLG